MQKVYSGKKGTSATHVPISAYASHTSRFRAGRVFLTTLACILIVRLFIVQVVDRDFYRVLASEQRDSYRELLPERGEILIQEKSSGVFSPLATNKDLYLVYANPRLIERPDDVAKKIAPLLGIESRDKKA